MKSLSRARIVVVGAGVLGLATAANLTQRGARVMVVDDAGCGPNASAVAAGMIAPGLEAALDAHGAEQAELYRRAADLWPRFAKDFALDYLRDGTDWRGRREPMAERLEALGVPFDAAASGLFLPGEGRVSARRSLEGLSAGCERISGKVEAVDGEAGRPAVVVDGRRLAADAVVLATGWRAYALAPTGWEGCLRRVTPVKGQILRLAGGGTAAVRRTVRNEGVYLVPTEGGVIVGATMEPGASDGEVDPVAIERLRLAAVSLEPALARASVSETLCGVRGALPDGLPMAGKLAPGLFVALAPRRNGWLLAPMVAGIVVAAISEEAAPEGAAAFRPDRFGPA